MRRVRVRVLASALRLAFAAGVLLAPLGSVSLPRDSAPESPQGPGFSVPEAPALDLATPVQAPKLKVAVAVILPSAAVATRPRASLVGELRPVEPRGADDQLRWSLGHGTTSSLH
jgi:hypothetical protein